MNRIKFLVAVILVSFQICEGKSALNSSQTDTVGLIEKVYLHTDRDAYFAGDDVWFKAYLVDALDHSLTNHSVNLHVELISPDLKLITTRVIRMVEGLGKGDFRLPGDLASGRYTIRVYTNYMRNFTDELFFTKEISVVSGKDNEDGISASKRYLRQNISLYFFPEGGSLAENVSSLVAFKAVDSRGLGCDIKGNVYSSSGDLINSFRSSRIGMGSFLLRPLPGLKYYAVFRGSDSIDVRTELPVPSPQGVLLSTSRSPDNELIVVIKTNPATQSVLPENELLLSISIRKIIINTITVRIKEPVTRFIIPTDYLPEGIVMLTLTSRDLPLSEKLVYIERKTPISIQLKTDKSSYKKREPVNLGISLYGDSLSAEKSNVSLSVANKTFINNTSVFPRTISSWFLLESDVRGLVEDPSYYFDPSNPDRLKDLDLLLLTQGWRDFSWKYDKVPYKPEDGFFISGNLKPNYKKELLSDYRVSIGIFGSQNSLITSLAADSGGRFELSGIDLTGQANAIVSGIDKKGRFNGYVILDSIKYTPAEVYRITHNIPGLQNSTIDSLKAKYEIYEALKKEYKLSDTIKLGTVNIIAERKDLQTSRLERSRSLYQKPDGEIIVTPQMETYPNIPELIRGKIPGVEVTGPNNFDPQYTIYIRGVSSTHGVQLPLVLIDGIESNYDDLIHMPVTDIDRVEILKLVSSTSIYGFRGANGAINLITKSGAGKHQIPKYTSKIKISGFDAPRVFYSPQHMQGIEPEYKPDLRSTVYWDPDINLEGDTETKLRFYNSDNPSTVRVIAEGITETGIPVSGKTEYEVR